MQELMIAIASAMPEEILIEEMKKALDEYRILKTEDSKRMLNTLCHMFLTKEIIDKVGVEKIMNDVSQHMDIFKRMNSMNQTS